MKPVARATGGYGMSALLVLALASLSTGCGLLRATAQAPGAVTRAVLPGKPKPDVLDPSERQSEFMRLADNMLMNFNGALTEFAELAGTEEAQLKAAQWRVLSSQIVVDTASRPDTIPALLDLIVVLRLGQAGLERRVQPDAAGEAARPLLDAVMTSQVSAWSLAARVLDEEQLTRARKVIDAWAAGLGEIESDAVLAAPSIEEIATRDPSGSTGLAGLFKLDPFAGLEPTTREIALARLYAERVLFVGKHLPEITRAQLELAALQARRQPETVQLMRDLERVSTAAQSFGSVADDLPAILSKEREAAIRQVLDGLDAQREGLVKDLEAAQAPVDEILVSSRATLEAAQATSTNLTELVKVVGTFLDRFESQEPDGDAAPPAPDGAPARPFDITEYGAAVAQLGDTARELTTLVTELDRSLPEVERIVDAAAQRGEESIDHAFVRALQLGLALIAATAAAVLVVRRRGTRRVESA